MGMEPNPSYHPDCLACQILAGSVVVPGGIIAENPWWSADHCLGAYGVGSVVIKSRAHRETLADLTPNEATSLGPFLQQVTAAIAQALGAERVYVNSWVDQPPYHIHFVLQPRYAGHAELGLKGLELQVWRNLQPPPDPEAMAAAADQIRQCLHGHATPPPPPPPQAEGPV